MSKSLPSRPNLEQLKNQAKELLHQVHSGESASLKRITVAYPIASPGKDFKLHDAQLVIAREYGFASWPKLKAEVELREKSFNERADLLVKCMTENQVTRARQLLKNEPELARANFYAACAAAE